MEQDHLLACAVASAGEAVVTVGLDGRFTSWNAAAQDLFGWPAEAVVGRPVADLIPPGREHDVQHLQSDDSVLVETVRRHRDGGHVPVALRLTPLREPDGRRIGTMVLARALHPELQLRAELQRVREDAESSFARSVLPQLTASADGVIQAVNPALCAVSGYAPEQLVGRPFADFVLDGELDEVAERWSGRPAGGVDLERHVRVVRLADGRVLEALVSVVTVRDPTGEVRRLEMSVEDVSALLAAERALRASERRFRSLALRSSDVAFLATAEGELFFATPSVQTLFGYGEEQLGVSGFRFVHPDDQAEVLAAWQQAVSGPGTPVSFRARIRHADGSWRWVEETATNLLDDPDIGAVVVNVTDITARKQAEDQLALLGETDQLTGLLTRYAVLAHLDQALTTATPGRTALVLVDLDGFRLVNAAHGHAVGDDVLTQVSQRLLGVVRGKEALGRIAGDRFAVVLSDLGDPAVLHGVVGRLAAALERPLQVHGVEVAVTATVAAVRGVAADPSVVLDSATLVEAAEAAVAGARRDGPGQVRVETAVSHSKLVARAGLVNELRGALARDELEVHYQPVVDLRTGRVLGAEALVRWAHPERGLVMPGEFIDAAEQSGLVLPLGEQVLRRACAAAARLVARPGGGGFRVAVNLSARQIAHPGVVAMVRDALQSTGCSSSDLVLEVTESAVMADVDAAGARLGELRDLGVELAVDDFGTGYSSLTYVKRLPVNTLKIDRSFVAGLGRDADDTAIVTSVVSLAATIGLDCVAEGVETQEQATALVALGCPAAQGYLWARPMDEQALDAWLREHGSVAVPRPAHVPRELRVDARRRRRPSSLQPRALARIRDLHSGGASLEAIATALNDHGLPSPDGTRWHARSVARVVNGLHGG